MSLGSLSPGMSSKYGCSSRTSASDRSCSILTFTEFNANVAYFAEATATPGNFVADYSVSAVRPLPAALPLFATGLGFIGFAGWRRKRNVQAVA